MAEYPPVSILAFSSARARDREQGLVGRLTLDVGGLLVVNHVALRRTRDGRLALSFPAPTDRRGRRRSDVRPLDDRARRAIERAVLDALSLPREEGGAA